MLLGLAEIVVIMAAATICLLLLIAGIGAEIKSVIKTWRTYDNYDPLIVTIPGEDAEEGD